MRRSPPLEPALGSTTCGWDMIGTDSLAGRAAVAFTAYRDGDHARLGDLIELLNPVLWRIARQHCDSPDQAEEAIASAWLKLVEHHERINQAAAVLGWLVVTVKREAWRESGAARRSPATDLAAIDMVSPEPGPERLSLLSNRQRLLWDHVRKLSPVCRRLLSVIAFAERPDYAGLAERLGMPVGSIGPTRGRCLEKLKKALAEDPGWHN